jgi:hypothetical protein
MPLPGSTFPPVRVPAGTEGGGGQRRCSDNASPEHGAMVGDQPACSVNRNAPAGRDAGRYEDLGGKRLASAYPPSSVPAGRQGGRRAASLL